MSENEQSEPALKATPRTWRPPSHGNSKALLIVVLTGVAIGVVLYAWNLPPFADGDQVTDNAYVRGRSTVIAPQVSGYVAGVKIKDYELVKEGQVLVQIDDRTYQSKVDQAKANLAAQKAALENNNQALASRRATLEAQTAALENVRAQLIKAKADMGRINKLTKSGAASIQIRDQNRALLAQAEAQVKQAQAAEEIARQDITKVEVDQNVLQAQVQAGEAALKLAEIDLEHTTIKAPEDGQVGEVGVRLGQYVTNGTQFLTLIPQERWVIANFKEAQTADMKAGQKVAFTVDALNNKKFKGEIERISPATGSEFAVLKPDNATGNFVKVPQRIGVRVKIDAEQPLLDQLRPGMSVRAAVDITK